MVQCTGGTIGDMFVAGDFFQGVLCTFSEPLGFVVVTAIVYGSIGLSLYIFSGSAILPLTLTIVLGGIMVSQLPGVMVQFVGVVVLLLLAAGGYYLVTSRGPAST